MSFILIIPSDLYDEVIMENIVIILEKKIHFHLTKGFI